MKDSKDIFEIIFRDLSNEGISVFPETQKKHEHQGWMSSVFTVESDGGKLMIHQIKPVKEHQKNKVWDKFHGLSDILASHPEIPAPKIVYSRLIGKVFVIVQVFIAGNRAGERVLSRAIISDKWKTSKRKTVPLILSALARLHEIRLKGFGWPLLKNNKLEGKNKTWKEFFETNYPLWIKEVKKADQRLSLEEDATLLDEVIKQIVNTIEYQGPAVLVHGDSINPSNILLNGKNKLAIVDWEWSISADPAWEFCDLGWWDQIDMKSLSPYFVAAKIKKHSERVDFINRIKIYIPLWLLWGTYMHANDANTDAYIALRKLLIEKSAAINKNFA